jgi:hypothetical protein
MYNKCCILLSTLHLCVSRYLLKGFGVLLSPYIALGRQRLLNSTVQQNCTHQCMHLNGFDIALHATSHSQLGPAREALWLVLLVFAPALIA